MPDIIVGTIGADPEYFLHDGKRIIPAHLKGFQLQSEASNTSVHRDGWAIETNPRPNTCRALFANDIKATYYTIRHKVGAAYKLLAEPAVEVDLALMDGAPEDLGQFGCMPSWCAYEQKQMKIDLNPFEHDYRYAGGHLHISHAGLPSQYTKYKWTEDKEQVFKYIQMLDRFLALPLTYLTGSKAHGLRRRYYGKAGEFRFQKHKGYFGALEYRVLGPEVFTHPALMGFAYGVLRLLYRDFAKIVEVYPWKEQAQVRAAVNAGVSHKDLLDLVLPIPALYTRKVLETVKPVLDKFPLTDVFAMEKYFVEAHNGWTEHLIRWTGLMPDGKTFTYNNYNMPDYMPYANLYKP